MTYQQGEAAALTLLQALAEWDTTNSISLANDAANTGLTLIATGASDHYLFLSPGPLDSGYETLGERLAIDRWQTLITLAVFIPVEGQSAEMRLTTYRQNAIAALDARFKLQASNVSMAKIVSGAEIEGFVMGDERRFITQEMTLLWEEERTITQGD